jgi:hypothetical protein
VSANRSVVPLLCAVRSSAALLFVGHDPYVNASRRSSCWRCLYALEIALCVGIRGLDVHGASLHSSSHPGFTVVAIYVVQCDDNTESYLQACTHMLNTVDRK